MKFIKRNENTHFNNKLIASLSAQFKLSEDIIKIIISKGFNTRREIINFLEPHKFKYHNPFLLRGMSEAVSLIKEAIAKKQRICVLGDYDTDGICATAIMYKYFESVNVKIDYFLPNRFVDGYGLTMDTVDKIIEEYNPDLLITVDCGISSFAEIEYAKQKGLKVIVSDHHEIPEIIPDCIVIDPKLPNQDYPFNELCGAGVALKMVQALAGYKFANKLTSIAAFATVADIVPLQDENRAIVYNGIKNYKQNLPVGVLKLMETLKITNLVASDISLKIAPKINTAGRMGDANIAFRLFVENDENQIAKQIKKLTDLNEIRVNDGAEIYEDAIRMLSHKNISNLKAIVLYNENWNGGVLGIVCAKLVEKFNRPVCLLSRVENEFKGSVRSIEKIDIYKQLSKLTHLLIRFGGHSQAGGLSIVEENIAEFERQLNENLANDFSESDFEKVKYYDLDLNKIELNSQFLEQLNKLEPFGFGNEKPVFKFTFNNAKIQRMKKHPQHIKLKINNLDMIAWNSGHLIDHLQTNSNKDLLIELGTESEFNNVQYVNAVVKSLKINKLNTNVKQDLIIANYLKQLKFLKDIAKNSYYSIIERELDNVLNKTLRSSKFGTLIVTNNFENYTKFVNENEKYITNYEMYEVNNETGENAILYLPSENAKISNFNHVIFLEPILTDKYLNIIENAQIYILNNSLVSEIEPLKNLSIDRKVFAHYHNAIKNLVYKNLELEDEYDAFTKLTRLNPQYKNFKFDQFSFVLLVLQELGIIQLEKGELFTIKINFEVKNPLENSSIYNFVAFTNKLID